jgi:hypothetical protein
LNGIWLRISMNSSNVELENKASWQPWRHLLHMYIGMCICMYICMCIVVCAISRKSHKK